MSTEHREIPMNNNGISFPTKQQQPQKNVLKEKAISILKKGEWNSPAGIDKIRIQCPSDGFSLDGIEKWTHVPNRKNQNELFPIETPLIRTTDGVINSGEKLYHNSNQSPGMEDTEQIMFNINQHGLSVEFNPSKQKGFRYGKLAGIGDVKEVVEDVLKYGSSIGLSFPSYDEIKMSRIDYAMDREMSLPVNQYSSIWSRVEMKRNNNRAEFPSGFYTGNDSREFNCYDKGAETEKVLPYSKYMRVEYRALKTKVNRSEGVSSLRELMDWDDAGIQKHYRDKVRYDLLKIKDETYQMLDFDDEIATIKSLYSVSRRSAVRKWIMCYGINAILTKGEKRWEDVRNIITATELYSRETVWKMIEEMKQLHNSLKSKQSRNTLIEKYNELCDKFAA